MSNVVDKLEYIVDIFIKDTGVRSIDLVFVNKDMVSDDMFQISFIKNSIRTDKNIVCNIINCIFIKYNLDSYVDVLDTSESVVYGTDAFFEVLEKWINEYEPVDIITDNVSELLNDNEESKIIKSFVKDNDFSVIKQYRYYNRGKIDTAEKLAMEMVYMMQTLEDINHIILETNWSRVIYHLYIMTMPEFEGSLFVVGDPSNREKLDIIGFPASNDKLVTFLANTIQKRLLSDKIINSQMEYVITAIADKEVKL